MITYNETARIYYDAGRITNLCLDFEPVVLEQAGNPLEEADDEGTNEDGAYANSMALQYTR